MVGGGRKNGEMEGRRRQREAALPMIRGAGQKLDLAAGMLTIFGDLLAAAVWTPCWSCSAASFCCCCPTPLSGRRAGSGGTGEELQGSLGAAFPPNISRSIPAATSSLATAPVWKSSAVSSSEKVSKLPTLLLTVINCCTNSVNINYTTGLHNGQIIGETLILGFGT